MSLIRGHFEPVGHPLELGDIREILRHSPEQLETVLGTAHLAHPEHDRHLDLVSRSEEPAGVVQLGLEIVLVDVGAKLDLLDGDARFLLASLVLRERPRPWQRRSPCW